MRKNTEQQRQLILESVDQLFYHKGYNAMSFSGLAQQAGLSKGCVYYYFKIKQDVFAAVIEHRLQSMKQMLVACEEEFPEPHTKEVEKLKTWLDEVN